MIARITSIPSMMWLAIWVLASLAFGLVWSLSIGRLKDRIEKDYDRSMRNPDGSLRWPGEKAPVRPPVITDETRALYAWETRTRRAERELGRDASRQPKGSGPRMDATNVNGFLRLNQ